MYTANVKYWVRSKDLLKKELNTNCFSAVVRPHSPYSEFDIKKTKSIVYKCVPPAKESGFYLDKQIQDFYIEFVTKLFAKFKYNLQYRFLKDKKTQNVVIKPTPKESRRPVKIPDKNPIKGNKTIKRYIWQYFYSEFCIISLEFLEQKTFFKTKFTLKKFSVSNSKILELNTEPIGNLKLMETLEDNVIFLVKLN